MGFFERWRQKKSGDLNAAKAKLANTLEEQDRTLAEHNERLALLSNPDAIRAKARKEMQEELNGSRGELEASRKQLRQVEDELARNEEVRKREMSDIEEKIRRYKQERNRRNQSR